MNDDLMLPEGDSDLSLSRRIGALLREGAPLDHPDADTAQKPFYRAMLGLRRERQTARRMPPAAVSERIWTQLAHQMARPAPGHPDVRTRRTDRAALPRRIPARAWAAVSALALVAAVVGWWLFRGTPAPGMVAQAGAEIVRYTAPDGSVVALRPRSKLYALRVGDREMRYRIEGEGLFEVTRRPERTFAVEAGGALVSVLGTRFDVSTWGERTTVYLEEGRLRLEHLATNESLLLEPGQRGVATPEGLRRDVEAAGEYLDWIDQELIFEGRPLHLIVAELEHHYGVTIEVPEALAPESLNGRILLDGVDRSLRDLGLALGGRFVQLHPERYRFEPD